MLVDHYRKDFMDHVIGHRIVIISHQDVDAVCTVRILTTLFKTEGVSYILLSCGTVSDMKTKYDEYQGQSNVFIMVNCGATVDLLETLGNPAPEKKFFLLDCHRPIHIINYYNSTGQIRIVSAPEPEENVPEFDQVFAEDPEVSDDSDDEIEEIEDDDEIDENGQTGRMRRRAERRNRRKKYEDWKRGRERILFNYREYSYYARPSALYALEVAWVMSRDDMESIWATVVALTESLVSNHISREKYTEFATIVNDHILRIANAEKLPRDCLKIRYERELALFLYRHWSVYESMKMTPHPANMLRTWSLDGTRRFHQLLAHLGLPLAEARQKYMSMSLDLRKLLVEMFSSDLVAERFRLPDLVFGSFVAEIGFRCKFNCLDVMLATLAVLEEPDPAKSGESKFLDAIQVLDVRNLEAFNTGVEKAKSMLKLLSSQVQMMVDTRSMVELGPFVTVPLSESLAEYNYFKRTTSLPLLVNFLQHAGIRAGKRKWKQCPWIITVPYNSDFFLVVGMQPLSYDSSEKNIFSEVFRVLKNRMKDDIILDFFDGWSVLVKTTKKQVFVDQLLAISE